MIKKIQNLKFKKYQPPIIVENPMSYNVRLNDWWCNYSHFKAFCLLCQHVIAVYSYSHLPLSSFINLVYVLHTINMTYQVQFHPLRNEDYWSSYTRPNFILDPQMRRKALGRPVTKCIHNEMGNQLQISQKKCSYCYHEGHHRGTCPFCQWSLLFCIFQLCTFFY